MACHPARGHVHWSLLPVSEAGSIAECSCSQTWKLYDQMGTITKELVVYFHTTVLHMTYTLYINFTMSKMKEIWKKKIKVYSDYIQKWRLSLCTISRNFLSFLKRDTLKLSDQTIKTYCIQWM